MECEGNVYQNMLLTREIFGLFILLRQRKIIRKVVRVSLTSLEALFSKYLGSCVGFSVASTSSSPCKSWSLKLVFCCSMLFGIPESLRAQENSSLKSSEAVSLWSSVETLRRFIASFLT